MESAPCRLQDSGESSMATTASYQGSSKGNALTSADASIDREQPSEGNTSPSPIMTGAGHNNLADDCISSKPFQIKFYKALAWQKVSQHCLTAFKRKLHINCLITRRAQLEGGVYIGASSCGLHDVSINVLFVSKARWLPAVLMIECAASSADLLALVKSLAHPSSRCPHNIAPCISVTC